MSAKSILLFVSGIVVGGAAGVFGSMKYFQNKYKKQYEEDHEALEAYYGYTDEYQRVPHEDEEMDDGVNSPDAISRPSGRMSAEERAEIKKKLNRNWEETTNYAGMYKIDKEVEQQLAESRHPLDQGEEGEEDPEDDVEELTPEEEAFDEHQKNKNKPPKIISAETYAELPANIDQETLYFYSYDEILTDENEETVDEPEYLIGDSLTKYGFVDNDEQIIFVMNYALNTCYEIQKVNASWTDTH